MWQNVQDNHEREKLRKREIRAKEEEQRIANNKKKTDGYYKKKEEEANILVKFLHFFYNLSYIEFFSIYIKIHKNITFIHYFTISKFHMFGFLLIHSSTSLNLYFTL